MNGTEYVLAWIEPYGQSTSYTRSALGDYSYLNDRSTSLGITQGDYETWDSAKGLFNRWGVVIYSQGSTVQDVKNKFDWAYTNGKIFSMYGHPAVADDMHDWNVTSGNADEWTDHISGNTSCWYCHLGTLYQYRYIATNPENAIEISSSGGGQDIVFNISVTETIHERYGLKYPVTYVFDVSSSWNTGYVYYRYRASDSWNLMPSKSSTDFFNGINASRFDFTIGKVYISVAFSSMSNNIFLKLRETKCIHDIGITDIAFSKQKAVVNETIYIYVTVKNKGSFTESFDVTTYYNSTAIETQSVTLDIGASTNLTHTWNTTETGKGDYQISAEASVVPDETYTTDNTKVADNLVIILSPGHDLAIKSVTPSKTVVGQGFSLSIHVNTKNYGTFEETFNITAYCNDTVVTLPYGKNYTTITLTSGNSTTVTFTWNTTGVAKGNYTVKAYAHPVPGETDLDDNTHTNG